MPFLNRGIIAERIVVGAVAMDGFTEAAVGWRHFPHGADIGVSGFGPSLAQAFEQAAVALIAVMTEPERVRLVQAIPITCDAPDPETLLVDWLDAVVYEIATRGMLFGRFEVVIEGSHLAATAYGEPLDPTRHQPAEEVKGATYTALRVAREGAGWVAACVVDV